MLMGLSGEISSPAYPPGRMVSLLPKSTKATAAAQSSPAPSLKVTPEKEREREAVGMGEIKIERERGVGGERKWERKKSERGRQWEII
jgi:hypothetical protein